MNKSSTKWKKSSLCESACCLEVAVVGNKFAVRDSKQNNSPILFFSKNEWKAFVAGVKKGEFDAT